MVVPPIQTTQMALIAAVVVTLSNGGYALNDICDRAIDKINQPGRPIPAGRISVPHALLIGSGNLVAAVVLAVPLSRWCIALTLTDAALLVAYAVWSKRLGPLKNILIGYLVASGFLIGAYNWDRIDPVIAVAACAFFGTIAREMVKDIQDIEGDRYHGAHPANHVWPAHCLRRDVRLPCSLRDSGGGPLRHGSGQQRLHGAPPCRRWRVSGRLAIAARLRTPMPIHDYGRLDRSPRRICNRVRLIDIPRSV
jgi:UbiA prenyltransferase family